MTARETRTSIAAQWGQLAAIALLAWFVALFPGAAAGAVLCEHLQAEFRALHGVTPDGLGCAVPGAATWALTGALIFALAVWWGSGGRYPRARHQLARSMLGVAAAGLVLPAAAFLVVGAQSASADRTWVLGTGVAYLVAVLSAVVGAWRGAAVIRATATAATVCAAAPSALYLVHHVFGVAVVTPVIAPGFALALAAALTAPRGIPDSAG